MTGPAPKPAPRSRRPPSPKKEMDTAVGQAWQRASAADHARGAAEATAAQAARRPEQAEQALAAQAARHEAQVGGLRADLTQL